MDSTVWLLNVGKLKMPSFCVNFRHYFRWSRKIPLIWCNSSSYKLLHQIRGIFSRPPEVVPKVDTKWGVAIVDGILLTV